MEILTYWELHVANLNACAAAWPLWPNLYIIATCWINYKRAVKAIARDDLSFCLQKMTRLCGCGLVFTSLVQIWPHIKKVFQTDKQHSCRPRGWRCRSWEKGWQVSGYAEWEVRVSGCRGVKSEGSRLFQSVPGSGDCLITLSWPPHTLTAGTGQQSCREERTGSRLR